ncbi:MAG: hypothetical protein IRY99_15890 [Isosphaeraceae bacterium]|nr:hypothetical protein [Isosphaeraceae bacterium]
MHHLSFAELLILGLAGLALALILKPSFRAGLSETLRHLGGHRTLLIVLAVLVAAPVLPPRGLIPVIVVAVIVLCVLAWLREFTYLMRLRDGVFPGHFDKLIWALLLMVLPPLGILAFWSYRHAHWADAKPEQVEAVHDWV